MPATIPITKQKNAPTYLNHLYWYSEAPGSAFDTRIASFLSVFKKRSKMPTMKHRMDKNPKMNWLFVIFFLGLTTY
jgi:hypothetical protein